ncbi:MAG: hypothetical protein ACI8UO_005836 [Verrucomicrobiales bacterium]|jgi:hypothetical protein
MGRKHEIYWYQESKAIAAAFLYNVRDGDLQVGGSIEKGEIIAGCIGFTVAERNVVGYSGRCVSFEPNRRCMWQGVELRCMAHPDIPGSVTSKAQLRGFNYAVAELAGEEHVELAKQTNVPQVDTPSGSTVINIELTTFQRQGAGNPRRAKLI